jgi:LPXTG-site transpeptidase (sortase) family protein
MKRKLLITFGIASPVLLLSLCLIVLLFVGVAGWLLLEKDEQSKIIRIMSLAPLETPAGSRPQAEALQALPPPAAQPNGAAPEAATIGENGPPAAPADTDSQLTAPLTPEEIEQALGFALPAGSVNSITREGVATRLVIPKLNLDAPVILSPIENQSWKVDHLGQQYVGHLEGTAQPGSDSNIVLAAHVTVSTGVYGPFAGLSQLEAGDQVFVYYGDQIFEYIVNDRQTVDRAEIEVTYPTQVGQVTLITCSKWDDQEKRYIERLVVTGSLAKG